MRSRVIVFLGIIALSLPLVVAAQAETPVIYNTYVRGEVIEVLGTGTIETEDDASTYQDVRIRVLEGLDAGQIFDIRHGGDYLVRDGEYATVGETVVLIRSEDDESSERYYIAERYRLPQVGVLFGIFFLLVAVVGRRQGVGAIVGLGISIAVIAFAIVPLILRGYSPLWVCVLGAAVIAVVSIFVAHGHKERTWLALASTLLTLLVTVAVAGLAVLFAKLSGAASEEAYYIQVGQFQNLDLRGLLFGAIIIGTLGVLDDVTTSQVAAIEEIHKANKSLSVTELYRRGMSVGREHIAALVNTLALAYAGASFPLFLLVAAFPTQPLWVTLNSQIIVEEVIRTLVGSAALVLAVPLSSLLAAIVFGREKPVSM